MVSSSPTCVDLFAGCGGLSLGLKQAGFQIKLAVEKSEMAAETYYHNLIRPIQDADEWRNYYENRNLEDQAESGLVVRELSDVLRSKAILSRLRESEIDVVAGGPPCQGFSSAGNRNPSDERNKLPWQFLEFIEKVKPKIVIIENVAGMQFDFLKHGTKSPFEDLWTALSATDPGYQVQPMVLNAKHFGVPQHRPRVFLVGLREDLVGKYSLGITAKIWDSSIDSPQVAVLGDRPLLAPKRTHFDNNRNEVGPGYFTVKDAISDLMTENYSETSSLSEFAREMREDTSYLKAVVFDPQANKRPNNHVFRQHSDLVMERFSLYQFLRDANIHRSVLAIPKKTGLSEHAQRKLLHAAIANVKYPAKDGNGSILANAQPTLMHLIRKLATKKHSQRALFWGRPAPTVVSMPDDFVHPVQPRIPTVRELARFQSFPDAFEFRSKETTGAHRRRFQVPQYSQVGNAVPPRLAFALGYHLREVMEMLQQKQGLTRKPDVA